MLTKSVGFGVELWIRTKSCSELFAAVEVELDLGVGAGPSPGFWGLSHVDRRPSVRGGGPRTPKPRASLNEAVELNLTKVRDAMEILMAMR